MKECSRCHIHKDLKDFSPSKAYKDKHASRCKSCQSEIMKEYRADNPEKTKEQHTKDNKKYWQGDARKIRDERVAEKRHTWLLEYWEKNAKKISQKAAAYYQENKEEYDARTTSWRKANPKRWTIIHARWVANKKGTTLNDFTDDQWQEIKAVFSYQCAYCPDDCVECQQQTHELTQDHITPLSRGGQNTVSNIVPACRSCNAKKNAGDVPCPVQPLLLTLAPAKPRKPKEQS